MALEARGVEPAEESEQRERLARRLIEKAGSGLWKEDA